LSKNAIIPDREDFLTAVKARKNKLKPYEQMLKKFQYKKALN